MTTRKRTWRWKRRCELSKSKQAKITDITPARPYARSIEDSDTTATYTFSPTMLLFFPPLPTRSVRPIRPRCPSLSHFHTSNITHWSRASDGQSIVSFACPSLAPLTLIFEQAWYNFLHLPQGHFGEHISVIRMLRIEERPCKLPPHLFLHGFWILSKLEQ